MEERVIAYIDGFNLYFGLKSKGWKRYYWLNQKLMIQNLLKSDQELVFTKYFSSRVSFPPDKVKRQGDYLEALMTLSDFQIYYGKYQMNKQACRRCGNIQYVPNEKMTDVNIAVEILKDAYQDKFDTALLISADSDLSAPVKAIKELFPVKKIIIAFPPNRSSFALTKLASAFINIGRRTFAKSIFPDALKKSDGFILQKPNEWQ
ncbi:MAG: NYN domain-containing protein [Ignavibacteriaceae bacterium]